MLVDARQGKQGENRDIGRRRLNFFGIISGHVDFFISIHSPLFSWLKRRGWLEEGRRSLCFSPTPQIHTTPHHTSTNHTHTHTLLSLSHLTHLCYSALLFLQQHQILFLSLSPNHTQTQPVYIPSIILLSIPPDERLDCPFRRPSLILVVCCCDPTAFGLVLPSSPSVWPSRKTSDPFNPNQRDSKVEQHQTNPIKGQSLFHLHLSLHLQTLWILVLLDQSTCFDGALSSHISNSNIPWPAQHILRP